LFAKALTEREHNVKRSLRKAPVARSRPRRVLSFAVMISRFAPFKSPWYAAPVRALVFVAVGLNSASAVALVVVESAPDGAVRIVADGRELPVVPGMEVVQGDRLRVPPNGQLRLIFGRHGFLDLGSGTDMLMQRLPDSSYAEDLTTVLDLQQGYLRLVWKHPQFWTHWPMAVALGALQVELGSGEYFFERRAGDMVACVAEGDALLRPQRAVPTSLAAAACYQLTEGGGVERRPRAEQDWVEVRNSFALATVLTTVPVRRSPEVSATPVAQSAAGRDATSAVWGLSVMSARQRTIADRHAERLREAGYAAAVREVQVDTTTWYRVVIPGFQSVAEARALQPALQELGYDGAWVARDRP
jgi:hypothetical protein